MNSKLVWVWGLAFPLAAISSIIAWRKLHPRKNLLGFPLALISLSALIIPIGLFSVASFSGPNFDLMLELNYNRALFP
jgi:CHASE2 domain-containing sensor protein